MTSDENKNDPQVAPESPSSPAPEQPASPWSPSAQPAASEEFSRPADSPVSEAPASEAPASEAPASEAPASEAPTSQIPAVPPTPGMAPPAPGMASPLYAAQPGQPGQPPIYPPGPPPFHLGGQPGPFPPGSGPHPYQPRSQQGIGVLPKIIIGAVAAVALGLTSGVAGGVIGYSLSERGGNIISVSAGRAVPASDAASLAAVAEKVQDSVVGVRTGSGEGSGVIFTNDGYVLTNNHVVAGASGSIVVTFSDNTKSSAKLVGTDPANDLAVLKVERTNGLHPITFGDSEAIKVGDPVLAIGNPLGYDGTVTSGILSAKNRTISEGGGEDSPFSPRESQPANRLSGLLQTDAAINPGNSGGALVDSAGNLVGINTAIATSGSGSRGNIGVGFAIPSNKVKSVAEQLVKGGKVAHPYIGVRVSNSDTQAGAELAGVDEGSPAAQAGLKAGDLVTAINGKSVKNSDELVSLVQSASPGNKISLTVVRDGKSSSIDVTVGEKSS